MRKDTRQKQIKLRKNFLPTLLITVILWIFLAGIVYFVDPNTFGIIPLFFIFIFLSALFSASSIFANTRRGLITAAILTIFLILRYFGVGNLLNLIVLFGIGIVLEIYLTRA